MKILDRIVVLLALVFGLSAIGIRAQATNNVMIEEAATVATCLPAGITPAPVVLCVTADNHVAVAGNGSTFVTIGVVSTGVTSLSVNGGAAQTGAVALKIPTSVTINQPTGTIQ